LIPETVATGAAITDAVIAGAGVADAAIAAAAVSNVADLAAALCQTGRETGRRGNSRLARAEGTERQPFQGELMG
jgi:hypothetical protein